MKRLLSAALALSLVAGPSAAVLAPAAASAQVVEKRVVQKPSGKKVVTKTKVTPRGTVKTTVKKKWAKGQRLPTAYRSSRYYVDHRRYKLRAPPAGYRWVRVDGEFLLIAAATGLIAEAIIASSY
jgi:Ni/Co efflux regulator RcnB